MQENLPCRRYCAHDYGGRLFIKIQKTTTRYVMCVSGLVNRIDGRRCH
jgi:uncharacterized protein (UPF0303 family)